MQADTAAALDGSKLYPSSTPSGAPCWIKADDGGEHVVASAEAGMPLCRCHPGTQSRALAGMHVASRLAAPFCDTFGLDICTEFGWLRVGMLSLKTHAMCADELVRRRRRRRAAVPPNRGPQAERRPGQSCFTHQRRPPSRCLYVPHQARGHVRLLRGRHAAGWNLGHAGGRAQRAVDA